MHHKQSDNNLTALWRTAKPMQPIVFMAAAELPESFLEQFFVQVGVQVDKETGHLLMPIGSTMLPTRRRRN
jgi:hypothetical protein